MRLLLLLALPAVFAAPALTASSGVPPTAGGAGAGAISGDTVSAISYTLDDEAVDAISFAVSPAGATTVRARLSADEPWTSCTLAGDLASRPVATPIEAASALEVVAAG